MSSVIYPVLILEIWIDINPSEHHWGTLHHTAGSFLWIPQEAGNFWVDRNVLEINMVSLYLVFAVLPVFLTTRQKAY